VLGDAQRGGYPQAPGCGQVQHPFEVYHRWGALRLLRWPPGGPFGSDRVSRLRAEAWRKRAPAVTVVVLRPGPRRLVRGLDGLARVDWACAAARYGCCGQADLAGEFRELAGVTPGGYLRSRVNGPHHRRFDVRA
jgi:hypothetical protein